jgi:hypothetical protein
MSDGKEDYETVRRHTFGLIEGILFVYKGRRARRWRRDGHCLLSDTPLCLSYGCEHRQGETRPGKKITFKP